MFRSTLPQFSQAPKPYLQINASGLKALQKFLRLVAEGEQDEAEGMLKKSPELALVSGDVTDLSKRTFNGITGFQYAVWALDWHMWTMIRKYLPPEEAQLQAQGFETGTWVRSHGVHANLNILIQAYQTTSDLYKASKRAEGDQAWVQQVGGAQFLLPAHVINEYCHPTRPFYPLPNFKEAAALPRTRIIDEGEWFTAVYNGGKLGEKFACYRGEADGAEAMQLWLGLRSTHPQDHDSLRALTSTRTAQREELIAELRPKSTQKNTSDLKELGEFLRLVAEGEQAQAEAMLKKNPALALLPGDVRDLSRRTFNGITGFQYAVWALDWHMWTMIKKHLPDHAALEQAQGFETGAWVRSHGVHANLNTLIQAYQTTIHLYNASKYDEGNTAWVRQVGGAQRLLPAHVINEYCHPTRSFYPLPNFKAVALPRTRKIDEGEWFTAEYSGGKLGEKFACYRSGGGVARAGRRPAARRGQLMRATADHDSVRDLASTRTAQREELIAVLRPKSVQMASPALQPMVNLSPPSTAFAQRPSPLTFLYPNLASILPKPIIELIQEYYVAPKDVAEFLTFVTEGEQDKAEAMLKKNPDLALVPGDVTDLSKRTFRGITAFQYAVWALDWHMWTMIKKYLPDDAALEQAQGFETGDWVKSHSEHFNLNILIQAYQTTSDLYNAKKHTEGNTAWVQQVGGAQRLLPAHVINEYCHPTRLFDPLPNFKDAAALPRTRTLDEGEWFTASYKGGKLGEKFACYRGGGDMSGDWVQRLDDGMYVDLDHDSVRALSATRTAQREELIAELRPKNVQKRVA